MTYNWKTETTKLLSLGIIATLCVIGLDTTYRNTQVQAEEFVRPQSVQNDPIVMERVVEKTVGCETQKCEITAYILKVFGDDAQDAITILNKCENHAFNPKATNHNRNGSIDRGVFQINSVHGGEELYDWHKNVDMAYKIFKQSGWRAWACSNHVGIKSFWQ